MIKELQELFFGNNPMQNMYDIIEAYARKFPEHEFFGKWGGINLKSQEKDLFLR
jgi:hypothetical protein